MSKTCSTYAQSVSNPAKFRVAGFPLLRQKYAFVILFLLLSAFENAILNL